MLLDKQSFEYISLKLLQKGKCQFYQNCFRVSFVVRCIPVSEFKIR